MSTRSFAIESGKLKAKEGDWRLPGISDTPVRSRTRNAGMGRPSFDHRFVEVELSSDSEKEEELVTAEDEAARKEVEEEAQEEEDEEDSMEGKKPPCSRVIWEVDPLLDLLQKNCRCPECGEKAEPTLCNRQICTMLKAVLVLVRM
jgi:hypothetical protein